MGAPLTDAPRRLEGRTGRGQARRTNASRRRPLGPLTQCADCARTRPLQLETRSPIRLVTGLRPPPRPITGPRLEYRVRLLWCWYVLSIRCAALEARVVGGLLSVRASLSVLAVSQDTGSHTKLTGNTGPTKEPVLPPG